MTLNKVKLFEINLNKLIGIFFIFSILLWMISNNLALFLIILFISLDFINTLGKNMFRIRIPIDFMLIGIIILSVMHSYKIALLF